MRRPATAETMLTTAVPVAWLPSPAKMRTRNTPPAWPAGMVMVEPPTARAAPDTKVSVTSSATRRSSSTLKSTSSPVRACNAVAAKLAVNLSLPLMLKVRMGPCTVTGAPLSAAALTVTVNASMPSLSSSSAMGMRMRAICASPGMRNAPPSKLPPMSPAAMPPMNSLGADAMVQAAVMPTPAGPLFAPATDNTNSAVSPSLTVVLGDDMTICTASEAAMEAAVGAARALPPSAAGSAKLKAMAKFSAPSASVSSTAVMVKVSTVGKLMAPVTAVKSAAVVLPCTMVQVSGVAVVKARPMSTGV